MSTLLMKQKEMMEKIQKATDILSSLIYQSGYENFRITQTGNVTGTNVLDVVGISLEIENNEYCMFLDSEDNLINQDTIISMFIIESLKDVVISDKDIRMEFNAGEVITIEPLR